MHLFATIISSQVSLIPRRKSTWVWRADWLCWSSWPGCEQKAKGSLLLRGLRSLEGTLLFCCWKMPSNSEKVESFERIFLEPILEKKPQRLTIVFSLINSFIASKSSPQLFSSSFPLLLKRRRPWQPAYRRAPTRAPLIYFYFFLTFFQARIVWMLLNSRHFTMLSSCVESDLLILKPLVSTIATGLHILQPPSILLFLHHHWSSPLSVVLLDNRTIETTIKTKAQLSLSLL